MTEKEKKRIKEICKVAHIDDISDLSDGYHTFKGLYYQRMILFATLVKQNRDKAWKSLRHEDGELCFGGGWFIVGIDTPKGSYTYHYEDAYFSLFDCEELERGKTWDGHTEKDVTRLLSLKQEPKETWSIKDVATTFERHGLMTEQEPCEDCISRIEAQRHIYTRLYESALNNVGYECGASDVFVDIAKNRLGIWISEIPSIQPKTGHWIDHQEDKWIYAQCSECETVHDTRTNYCPNCGCRMVEPQESEDKE